MNNMYTIHDALGVWRDNLEEVNDAFLSYYKSLVGTPITGRSQVHQEVINMGHVLDEEQCRLLATSFCAEEVKQAIFSIPGGKSPEPDGFGSSFFKDTGEIVGREVKCLVLEV